MNTQPLQQFLAGRPPASLPTLSWRSSDGGGWIKLAETSKQEIEEIINDPPWAASLRRGDLLRVESSNRSVSVWYGIASNGRITQLPSAARSWTCQREGVCLTWASRLSWPEAWESCPNAAWMLWAARELLDRQTLARTAVACVRARLPQSLTHLGNQLDVIEAWAFGTLGRGAIARVSEVNNDLAEKARNRRGDVSEEAYLLNAASLAAAIPEGQTYLASLAVESALGLLVGEARDRANLTLANIVRREIPLRVVVTALADAPNRSWHGTTAR